MNNAARVCYAIIFVVVALAPCATVPSRVLSFLMAVSIVYIAARLSFETLLQRNPSLLGSGHSQQIQVDTSCGEEDNTTGSLLLLALIGGPCIVWFKIGTDVSDLFISEVQALVGVYGFMAAFGPLVFDLVGYDPARVPRRNIGIPCWGHWQIQRSPIWLSLLLTSTMLAVAWVWMRHNALNHLFGAAITIQVAQMYGHNPVFFMVPALIPCFAPEDSLDKRRFDEVTMIKFSSAFGEPPVVMELTDLMIIAGLISVVLHKDFWDARQRNEQPERQPFKKPLFHTALVVFVVAFGVSHLIEFEAPWSPLKVTGFGIAGAIAAKVVLRGDLRPLIDFIKQSTATDRDIQATSEGGKVK